MGTIITVIRDLDKSASFIGYAIRLGRDLLKRVHVMYIEEEYDYTLGPPPATADYTSEKQAYRVSEAEHSLFSLLQAVLKELPGDALVDSSAELGAAETLINKRITSVQNDLVLLNADEDSNFFLRKTSNSEISDELNCPVLIIPGNIIYKPVHTILYASVFPEKDGFVIKNLLKQVSSLSPAIRIVHMESKPAEIEYGNSDLEEVLQKQVNYDKIRIEDLTEERRKSIVNQVRDLSLKVDADLIAMLREDRSFFEKVFTRDKAREFLKASGLPVLVMKT